MSRLLLGVNVAASIRAGEDPVRDAIDAEALGFDFISINDHPLGIQPSHEAWTLLSWIAARTTRLMVAPRVLAVPFRPAPVVAKMAATLDALSDGRLILGVGGGANDDAVAAAGLPLRTPRQKVDGMEEAVRIMKGMWAERSFTFHGTVYHVDAVELSPKPARPIPVWLGTFGPRGLAVTGRVADGWIPSLNMAPPEAIPAMRAHIERGARQAGRDPDSIMFVYNVEVALGVVDPDDTVVSGSPDQVADRFDQFLALGFRALNIIPKGNRTEQTQWLARDVLPRLRALPAERPLPA